MCGSASRHSLTSRAFPLAIIVPIDVGTSIREYQHVVKVGVNYRFGAY
jgi:hypothetical protein